MKRLLIAAAAVLAAAPAAFPASAAGLVSVQRPETQTSGKLTVSSPSFRPNDPRREFADSIPDFPENEARRRSADETNPSVFRGRTSGTFPKRVLLGKVSTPQD